MGEVEECLGGNNRLSSAGFESRSFLLSTLFPTHRLKLRRYPSDSTPLQIKSKYDGVVGVLSVRSFSPDASQEVNFYTYVLLFLSRLVGLSFPYGRGRIGKDQRILERYDQCSQRFI
ncbi:hypothetical protein B296_00000861 [Ensete ventricosum]|uniref:Uncharacterized protein n=1 Tax=Ensete ventricosum TaxID=4639 RepID=A0A427BCI4_ENSVE|nr:hypothetical protein B296_00000861 [Ensete ventricosum]